MRRMKFKRTGTRLTAPLPFRRRAWEFLKSLLLVAAVLFPIRSSLADWNDVPSGSMEPTILPGDRIWVNKLAYGLRIPFTHTWLARWDNPAQGEIVILASPKDGTRLVKRLIAGPGDRLELREGRLYVNGTAQLDRELSARERHLIVEPYIERWATARIGMEQLTAGAHAVMFQPRAFVARTYGPVQVPDDSYFVMGDNRDLSADSRVFGFVKRDVIVGRTSAVVLSVDLDHWYAPRLDRIFHGLR